MNLRLPTCILFIAISFASTAQNETERDTLIVFSDDSTKSGIFEKVDIEASFPGGESAWRKYLERNLRADVAVENGAPAGQYTTWIQFVVDKDGNITDVKALTNNGYGMEQEVMRLIKKGPQWQPASQNGRLVKAYRKQPVTFIIEEDGFQIKTDEPYVLYSGVENHINIIADKVKPNDLEVTISQGTIIPKGGSNYTVRVPRPGRVIIQLFNKKHKLVGEASLEVKQKGQPLTPPTLKS